MKNHILEVFAQPPIGVIIGCNGYIWIEACRPRGQDSSSLALQPSTTPISEQERVQIAILRNGIALLDKAKLPIYRDTILKVIEE